MTKHFEEVWEEAEEVNFKSSEENLELISADKIENILDAIKNLEHESTNKKECLGRIIYDLCFFSKKHNVNVWTALEEEINNRKIDSLE